MSTPSPICPTCGQPASLALATPAERWECRNEACPEFGQLLDPRVDRPEIEQHAARMLCYAAAGGYWFDDGAE